MAQKWQILVVICAWGLHGQNLASCWHILLAPGATPQLFLKAWSPKWSPEWPTWVQKRGHFEAQKWQIPVGICAWRLYGQNLASCWHVLLGFWAPGANPQLFLKAWSPKWTPDRPTWAQKKPFGGPKIVVFVGKGPGGGQRSAKAPKRRSVEAPEHRTPERRTELGGYMGRT